MMLCYCFIMCMTFSLRKYVLNRANVEFKILVPGTLVNVSFPETHFWIIYAAFGHILILFRY